MFLALIVGREGQRIDQKLFKTHKAAETWADKKSRELSADVLYCRVYSLDEIYRTVSNFYSMAI